MKAGQNIVFLLKVELVWHGVPILRLGVQLCHLLEGVLLHSFAQIGLKKGILL